MITSGLRQFVSEEFCEVWILFSFCDFLLSFCDIRLTKRHSDDKRKYYLVNLISPKLWFRKVVCETY